MLLGFYEKLSYYMIKALEENELKHRLSMRPTPPITKKRPPGENALSENPYPGNSSYDFPRLSSYGDKEMLRNFLITASVNNHTEAR